MVERSPFSKEAFEFIREALEDCTRHDFCRQDSSVLPPPVIGVGEDDSRDPFLYITGHEAEEYAALSYWWRGRVAMRITEQTLQTHLVRTPLIQIPASFHRAVQVW
jgi:hypothetical protein